MAHDLLLNAYTPHDWSCGIGDEGAADPLVWTPSAIRSEFARVRGVLDTANAEVSAASKRRLISAEEWQRWRAFYVDAHKFVDEASTLWGSNVSQVRRF